MEKESSCVGGARSVRICMYACIRVHVCTCEGACCVYMCLCVRSHTFNRNWSRDESLDANKSGNERRTRATIATIATIAAERRGTRARRWSVIATEWVRENCECFASIRVKANSFTRWTMGAWNDDRFDRRIGKTVFSNSPVNFQCYWHCGSPSFRAIPLLSLTKLSIFREHESTLSSTRLYVLLKLCRPSF